MMGMKKIYGCTLLIVTVLLCVALFSFKAGRAHSGEVIRIDTIVIIKVDTVKIERIIEKTRTVYKYDTVWLQKSEDKDSASVVMPMERKVYSDSLYRAVISGYKPELEELVLYPRTKVIYKTEIIESPQSRFECVLGPQVGWGKTPTGWRPYVGVGVTVGWKINFRKYERNRRNK